MKSAVERGLLQIVRLSPAHAENRGGVKSRPARPSGPFITLKAIPMQIIFLNETPEYSGRELTLAFPAMVDGERVECMITAEALEDHFGAASPRQEDMIGAFDTHRERIEAATRRLLSETRAQCLVLRSGYVRFYEANWRN
jgi:hypothetical protein